MCMSIIPELSGVQYVVAYGISEKAILMFM